MNNYAEVYVELDPAIRENPDMGWAEFIEKFPKLSKRITNWSFCARRKRILHQPGYGNSTPIKENAISDDDIKNFIDNIHPMSKCKDQYLAIAKALMENSKTTHSFLTNQKIITLSDAHYYQFRTAFNKFIGKTHKTSSSSAPKLIPKKRSGLYRVIFEKDSNGIDKTAKDLMNEFISKINDERMANLELVELSYPEQKLEIRSYAK